MSNVRYELVRVIGAGGMATVHLGRSSAHGMVAIKRLHDFLADDPASVAAFIDEGRMLACISHPNVVRVIDVVELSGSKTPSLVLEWIDGTTLDAIRGSALPLDVVVAIARDLLAGLHAAHEAEIVHRDVSPDNVLVGLDGVARLTDFGIAKAASARMSVTEADAVKGKLRYLAPEQLAGRADRRTDVYAAGIVLWELLTGRRLRTRDGIAIVVEVLDGHVDAPSRHSSDAHPLDEIVLRALSRDPEERFSTAQEMVEALVARVTPASPARVAAVLDDAAMIRPDFAEEHGVALAS